MPFKLASTMFNGQQNARFEQNAVSERKTMLYTTVFTHDLYEVWIIYVLVPVEIFQTHTSWMDAYGFQKNRCLSMNCNEIIL